MACLGDESATPKGADITPDIVTLIVAMKDNMDQNNAMLATLMSKRHKRPLPYDGPNGISMPHLNVSEPSLKVT